MTRMPDTPPPDNIFYSVAWFKFEIEFKCSLSILINQVQLPLVKELQILADKYGYLKSHA
jgi:hypothetical protein